MAKLEAHRRTSKRPDGSSQSGYPHADSMDCEHRPLKALLIYHERGWVFTGFHGPCYTSRSSICRSLKDSAAEVLHLPREDVVGCVTTSGVHTPARLSLPSPRRHEPSLHPKRLSIGFSCCMDRPTRPKDF